MKKLLAIIIMAITFMGCTQQPPKLFEKHTIMIHSGDTLWSIASKYSGDTYILEYIEDLKALKENQKVLQANRLLQPGDKITVLDVR